MKLTLALLAKNWLERLFEILQISLSSKSTSYHHKLHMTKNISASFLQKLLNVSRTFLK